MYFISASILVVFWDVNKISWSYNVLTSVTRCKFAVYVKFIIPDVTAETTPAFELCPQDQYKLIDPAHSTAKIGWTDPVAFDSFANQVTVTCQPPKGEFLIGQTEVVCEAIDDRNNKAYCTFNVTVTGIVCGCPFRNR